MSRTNALQAALTQNSGRQSREEDVSSVPSRPEGMERQSSRAEQSNVSAWLHKDYQTGLRMIHATTGRKKQELIAEALNDLFAKYDVPQVREE